MGNVALRTLVVFCALIWTGCGDDDGDERPAGSGGAASGGSGGTQQGGTSAGGSTGSGGAAGLGSGGAGVGGSAGATGGSGGTGTDTFACGPLMCRLGEDICHRDLPALPGASEQRACEPFPDGCSAADCTCFCDPGTTPPCQTEDFCACSGENGRIEVVCAGP